MSVAFGAVYAAGLGRLADPGTAVYRRGHGRRPPPPGQVVTDVRARGLGPFVEAERPGLLPPAQRLGRRQGGQRLVGAPDLDRSCRRTRPDRRPDPRPPAPADAVGLRLRAARPGRRLVGRGGDRGLHRRPSATACRRPPGGSATCGSTPRSRPTARSTPTARCDAASRRPAGARRRRSSRTRPGSSTCAPTRTRCGATCARSGASTSTRPGPAGSWSSTPGGDRLGEFYRIYRETADRAGFLIRDRVGLPRRLGGVRAGGQRPAAVRPDRRRRAAGDALPRPLRAAGRRAVRRDDRGRRRVAGELPAQVGGDPLVARSRAPRATTCGASRPAGSPISRPGSAVARSATSAPGTSSSTRSGDRPTSWRSAAASAGRAGAAGSPTAGSAAAYGRGRLNVRDAIADELADWDAADRRGARRPRLPVAGLGRASRARRGWQPRFLVADDGGRALALVRPWPAVPGGSAYLPRGPVPTGAEPAALGARLIASADALADDGIDVVAADPEVPAADTGFRTAIEGRRVPADRGDPAVAPPDQPRRSTAGTEDERVRRHRQVDPPADPDGASETVERVVRHDARVAPGGPGDGFERAERGRATPRSTGSTTCCSRPASGGTSRSVRAQAFVAWWRAALAAGHLVYLEAVRDRRRAGRRADPVPPRRPAVDRPFGRPRRRPRRTLPGALHLLRWRAIQLAIREGCDGDGPRRRRRGRRPPRAGRGRPDVRPVPAQGVVRRPMARADRRPRAGRTTLAATARAASPAGWRKVLGR